MEAHESARIAQNMQLLLDEFKEFRSGVGKELRDMHDVDKMACDQILSIRNDIICLIRRIERLESDKSEAATPLEPAKINLTNLVHGQEVITRRGNRVRFIGIDDRRDHFKFVVRCYDDCHYFACDVYGSSEFGVDYDIVEILPLEDE